MDFPLELERGYDFLFHRFGQEARGKAVKVEFVENESLSEEEYLIKCLKNSIHIEYRENSGRFYALGTLLQVLQRFRRAGRFPAFEMRDKPRLSFRGFMLDVSRGAVPHKETLRKIILDAALLKLNYFSLYIEASFASQVIAPRPGRESYLEKEELEELCRFAGRCHLELFPSLQMLCHLEKLLDRDAFSSFAGVPGKGCIDPGNARAVEWIKSYAAEIAGIFPGPHVNIGFDECQPLGNREAFIKYLLECYRFFAARGKKVMVWGDMFSEEECPASLLPDEVVVLNWDYFPETEEGFSARAAQFRNRSPARQVLCSGTWSWAKFIPATRRSMLNTEAAFAAAERNRLAGVMLTSWGDDGNEYLPEGIYLSLFHAGNLLWSGAGLNAAAFSLWLCGREDLDLFRLASFLGQVDHPLPYTHRYYLYEDPLSAPFSRQGDGREVVARYSKAAAYLGRKSASSLIEYHEFCRRLFLLLATKVDFSLALPALLRAEKNAQVNSACDRLINELEQVRDLYGELWLSRYKAQGLYEIISRFNQLIARYQYLQAVLKKKPGELLSVLGRDNLQEPHFSIRFQGIFSQ